MFKTQIFIVAILIQSIVTFSQNDTILIDFGNVLSDFPWNNVTHPDVGQFEGLINSKGFQTDLDIIVNDVFNGINTNGTQIPNPGLDIPVTASGDSFFGNPIEFANKIEPTGGVEISNLSTDKLYTLNIFSSRDATDNRETQYLVIGETTDTLFLDVASNTDEFVISEKLPAADGTIQIIASTGPNNTNTYGFFYLGSLKLIYETPPNQGAADLHLISPNGGEFWQVGKTAPIWWESQNIGEIHLEYSIDAGNTWENIATVPAFQKEYDWEVPAMPSMDCLVRISGDTLSDNSDAFFEISDNSDICPIVVLGSSTAAGVGPSSPDSTWVNRYRKTIYQKDTRYEVINLAIGGYTTYHILPTGSEIPSNISIIPDTARNMTKALSFDPFAVIVNMPSNDAANNFSVEQQLNNFEILGMNANDIGTDIWICTTQPRNFANPNQIAIQTEVRDSIFQIYGNNAIDFWSDMADNNGMIATQFDSGDGVHLNDAAHKILFERVLEKGIDTLNCSDITNTDEAHFIESTNLKIYPNPFSNLLNIEFESYSNGTIKVELFDMLGRLVYHTEKYVSNEGLHQVQLTLGLTPLYFYQILFGHVLIEDGKGERSIVERLVWMKN